MDDADWEFLPLRDDDENPFYIGKLNSLERLRAVSADGRQLKLEVTKGVDGELWNKEYEKPYAPNEESYFIIKNEFYGGVLYANFDKKEFEMRSKISLLLGAK